MKPILILITGALLGASALAAEATFMKKCEADAQAKCEASASEKKLAGAAKTSHVKKCVGEAVGS